MGQGLEIRTLPGTAPPQQSHSVPMGHPKPVTAGGGGSKGPLESQIPVLCGCSQDAKTGARPSPPAPAGSSCPGGSKVRQMFLTLPPSGHGHPPALRRAGAVAAEPHFLSVTAASWLSPGPAALQVGKVRAQVPWRSPVLPILLFSGKQHRLMKPAPILSTDSG